MLLSKLTVPATLLVLGATVTVAEKPFVTLDELLDSAGFSEQARDKIHQGEVVSEGLDDELTDTHLGVAVAVHIDVPPMELLDYLRKARDHREDPDLLGFGDIDENDLDGSFAAVEFTADEGDEIRKLLAAEPGAEFNFSTDEYSRFAELRERFSPKGCPEDPACVDAVMSAYRAILRGRFETYRKQGVEGLAAYARADGETTEPSSELQAVAKASILKTRRPEIYEAVYGYPEGNQELVTHTFQWFKVKSQDRPNFILSHRIELLEPPAAYELMRQFYSTSSFNCSVASSGLFPIEDRTFFFFYNRTFTDQVTGFMAGTRKKMGGKMMAKSIREDLLRLQQNLDE
jgi:hypothetical protein